MRKSFLALPLIAAGLVVACSSADKRSGFETDVAPNDPADAGFVPSQKFQPNGSEQIGDIDASQGCSSSQTSITRTPVVLEFVVDESGSMMGDKWNAQRDALLAAFDDMNTTPDPALFVGVQLFDDQLQAKVAPAPFTDPDHNDDLHDIIDKPDPSGGGTGTEKALQAGFKVVDKFKPPASSAFDTTNIKRIVVLMSDGAPTGGTSEQSDCEQDVTDEFSQTPPAGPVLTFAIGVGEFPSRSTADYDPGFMGRIAVAGGTAPAGCDPDATDVSSVCHFQVTPGDDPAALKDAFLAALNKIRALSAPCEFKFAITGGADPNNIKVTMTAADGTVTPIKKDATNGWSFDNPKNPTKVLLHGNACSASNGTVSGRVDVVLGCKQAQ